MTIQTTPNFDISYVAEGQANAEYQVNHMLATMDAFLQFSVLDDNPSTTPPVTPAEGDRYIVPAAPTNAWAFQAGQVAVLLGGRWRFFTPRAGWLMWVEDINQLKVYDGTTWQRIGLQGAAITELSLTAGGSYSQTQMQSAVDKIDELIANLQSAGHTA